MKGNKIWRLPWNFVCPDFINPLNHSTFKHFNCKRLAFAFTMAEILISLTIIGIIAAITLPSLIGNIKEKAWATQKKAVYSRLSQAISMLPSLNGYGATNDDAQTAQNAANAFITEGLSKVLEINNICDNQHFKDCGISDKFKTADGQKQDFPKSLRQLHNNLIGGDYGDVYGSVSMLNTHAAAFETKNGESIAVFYQPYCISFPKDAESGFIAQHLCANFIIDLNGKKGPNTVGKDIRYISVFYPTDSFITAPEALPSDSATGQRTKQALTVCRNLDSEYRLPTLEEMASITVNKNFYNLQHGVYISATVFHNANHVNSKQWKILRDLLIWNHGDYETGLSVRCIKR